MVQRISNLDKRFLAIFSVYLSVLLYHTSSFLSTTELAGRDLVGAYSLVEVFEFGWNTDWFLGFPLFQFYPPGFFFTADFLGTFIGTNLAFRLLVYSLLIFFPVSVYYCFKSVFDRETALVSLVLCFPVVFLFEPFSVVYQTLQVGLVAQMFALPFLFLYIGVLCQDGRGYRYLSALLIALMILSHPYIASVAVLYTVIFFLLTRNLFKAVIPSIGFGLTAWFWIPIVENYWYMQNYVGTTGNLLNWPWIFMPFLLLDRGRRAVSLALLGLTLLIIGTFNPGLEFQSYRFFTYGQIITVLTAAPGILEAFNMLETKVDMNLLLIILVGVFALSSLTVADIDDDWSKELELDNVVPEEGRMIVETSHSDIHNSYVPIQMIPLQSNVSVVNGLYAESSISSPYLLGLEKSFAEDPIPNKIAVEADIDSEQLEERFRYFGIDYALVRTDYAQEKLNFMEEKSKNSYFTLLKWDYQKYENEEKIIVHGDRERWEKINEEIFKDEIERGLVYSHYENGNRLENRLREDLLSQNKTETVNKSLQIKSIRPEENFEGVFSISVSNNK